MIYVFIYRMIQMIEIPKNNYVACICEGASEKTIINMLLKSEDLIFTEDQLLGGEIIVGCNSRRFIDEHLQMDYEGVKIDLVIVQDTKKWKEIKAPYNNQINNIYFCETSPEIEMLMIHSMGLFEDYQKKKSTTKPSLYIAQYKQKKSAVIKSQQYIKDFYDEHDLKDALKIHKSKSKKSKDYFLADLLK